MSSEALERGKWTYPARLRVAAEAPAVRAVLYQGLLLDAAAAYERLEAALAVAREREQHAVEALGGLVAATERAVALLDAHDSWLPEAEALSVALRAARAALVDEPAAERAEDVHAGYLREIAAIAERYECQHEHLQAATGLLREFYELQQSPRSAVHADGPLVDKIDAALAALDAPAADAPAHKRPASSDGMGRTPPGGRATQDPEIGASPCAAADEPMRGGLIHTPTKRVMGVDAPDLGDPIGGAAADEPGETPA